MSKNAKKICPYCGKHVAIQKNVFVRHSTPWGGVCPNSGLKPSRTGDVK